MEKWISIISGLAAFMTALTSLYIILEMKKQRMSMYLPDFAFPLVGLHLYQDNKHKLILSTMDKLDEANQPRRAYLEILNIGLGAAKDVVIEWNCDVDKFLSVINEYITTGNPVIKKQGLVNMLVFASKIELLPEVSHIVQNQLKLEIPHIIPMHVEPTPHKVAIPPFYLDLYLHYLYYVMYARIKGKSDISEEETLKEPIPLKLTVTYKDIGNNIHKLQYELQPFFYIFGIDADPETGRLMEGGLKLEKVQ